MFLTSKLVSVEAAVDLRQLPTAAWPEEARHYARVLLAKPAILREFTARLHPRDWLIARIERVQAAERALQGALEAHRASPAGPVNPAVHF